MPNFYSTIAENLSRAATETLPARLAPLKAYATVLPLAPKDLPGVPSQVPFATSPAPTQTGPNPDFYAGDSKISNIPVVPSLIVQAFGLSGTELQEGANLDWIAGSNARALAEAVHDNVFSLLTVANYGAALASVSPGEFVLATFEGYCASVPSANRAVVLNSPYAVKVKPMTWLDKGTSVFEASRWTAAGTNVCGFVADPKAIVCRHGPPQLHPFGQAYLAVADGDIPQLGIKMQTSVFLKLQDRSVRAAYSLFFGSAVGDAAALKLLQSAPAPS